MGRRDSLRSPTGSRMINFSNVSLAPLRSPQIGLRKLTKISRGGVRIEKNPALCYTNTLNWDAIVTAGDNFIKDNSNESSCPSCSQCPDGYCWTAQHCQVTNKTKCHHQCLGECYGTTESDCYVCKHYRHEGKCVENCPDHL